MAHAQITPKDEDTYDEGDAIRIPFDVTDEHDSSTIDITGMSAEFRLKESLTDADADALVEKIGEQGVTEDQIAFTDATNGKCEVIIESDPDNTGNGDTDGVLTGDDGVRADSKVFEWHFRVIDSNGNRVTAETGDWTIHAS